MNEPQTFSNAHPPDEILISPPTLSPLSTTPVPDNFAALIQLVQTTVQTTIQMQQQTILEQQRTINIYAKQASSFEDKIPSAADGLGQLAPILNQIVNALKGVPANG